MYEIFFCVVHVHFIFAYNYSYLLKKKKNKSNVLTKEGNGKKSVVNSQPGLALIYIKH